MVARLTKPASTPDIHRRPIVGASLERCIYCRGTAITRQGRRRKKFEEVQLWSCRTCGRTFTAQRAKGRTYPLKIVVESLMLYYRGETRARTAKAIKERFGINVPPRTLSSWLADYRELTTYARLRDGLRGAYRPARLVRSTRLHHKQVYKYCVHSGKLDALLAEPAHRKFGSVGNYLGAMLTDCPHSLFQTDARASQGKAPFDLDAVAIAAKRNHACRLADLCLQAVTMNKRRHDELQRFMLLTDSATVAVEVPIYLTGEDIAHFNEALGFAVPLDRAATLTGHIDILQLRGGAVHILDYKPKADKEKPIVQLMVYALALSRRTGLKLFDFVCAWFDEDNYYEFFPLHVVHKAGRGRASGREHPPRDEQADDRHVRKAPAEQRVHRSEMGAGGQHVVDHRQPPRRRVRLRLVDSIEIEQRLDRDPLALHRLVRGDGRIRLDDEGADIDVRADGAADPLHPVVMVGMAGCLGAGDRHQARLGEPRRIERAAQRRRAVADRPHLIVVAGPPRPARLLLEVADQVVGAAEAVVAVRGIFVEMVADVVRPETRMVVAVGLVDLREAHQPSADQMSSESRTRIAPSPANLAGQLRPSRAKQESRMNSLRPWCMAARAWVSVPDVSPASMITVPSVSALIVTLRSGKNSRFCGGAWR